MLSGFVFKIVFSDLVTVCGEVLLSLFNGCNESWPHKDDVN